MCMTVCVYVCVCLLCACLCLIMCDVCVCMCVCVCVYANVFLHRLTCGVRRTINTTAFILVGYKSALVGRDASKLQL